ncbi:MAG: creatininase family protein [Candidatus Nitrosoabyssus spongiisocia]|nr:MAG: creatininase family protein [Nitrosopumilaceae archaeon AB1(1)]
MAKSTPENKVSIVDILDQFDPLLRKNLKNNKHTALIPIGSIEQHGSHLPVSTDLDIVNAIAKRLATKMKFILLPSVSYGISFEHKPFFNLSIRNSTMQSLLLDICNSLLENNIKKIIILNGHHGNQDALKKLERKINKKHVSIFSYWHFMNDTFDHAGLIETSLMLAISKNVKMNLAKPGLLLDGMTKKEILQLSKKAELSFPSVTPNGVWGDPTKATATRGKQLLAEIVNNLAKECKM